MSTNALIFLAACHSVGGIVVGDDTGRDDEHPPWTFHGPDRFDPHDIPEDTDADADADADTDTDTDTGEAPPWELCSEPWGWLDIPTWSFALTLLPGQTFSGGMDLEDGHVDLCSASCTGWAVLRVQEAPGLDASPVLLPYRMHGPEGLYLQWWGTAPTVAEDITGDCALVTSAGTFRLTIEAYEP